MPLPCGDRVHDARDRRVAALLGDGHGLAHEGPGAEEDDRATDGVHHILRLKKMIVLQMGYITYYASR